MPAFVLDSSSECHASMPALCPSLVLIKSGNLVIAKPEHKRHRHKETVFAAPRGTSATLSRRVIYLLGTLSRAHTARTASTHRNARKHTDTPHAGLARVSRKGT